MEEQIVLVDDDNNQIGTAPKFGFHTATTPLHRAFSLFIFNQRGELLLQQRCIKKVAFPLIWSNSCCGHPLPGETTAEAARRRAEFELGLNLRNLNVILPYYRYRAEMQGIVENELCPVAVATTFDQPLPNKDEVEAIRWISWSDWLREISEHPKNYSPWCVEETLLLEENLDFKSWLVRLQPN